jgi:DNA repair exonuclease SbcCD ATPase subunit
LDGETLDTGNDIKLVPARSSAYNETKNVDLSGNPETQHQKGVNEYMDRSDKKELENEISDLKSRLENLQQYVDERTDTNSQTITQLKDDVKTKANYDDFNQLKYNFNSFSKRLKRIAKEEDALNKKGVDPGKIPPDVLEITYAKTLNDLLSAMLDVYGKHEVSNIVNSAIGEVRESSPGVDFFRFENNRFVVKKLSEAVESKLVSRKQIHGTYVELYNKLSVYVPSYEGRDFRSFVETGSLEYAVDKVTIHETKLNELNNSLINLKEKTTNFSKDLESINEIQNKQSESIDNNSENISAINNQIEEMTNAINLHTRAIKTLNKKLADLQNAPDNETNTYQVNLENRLDAKAEKNELMEMDEKIQDMNNDLASFKQEILESLENIQYVLENKVDDDKLTKIEDELLSIKTQISNIQESSIQPDINSTDGELDNDDLTVLETLKNMETATFKKLEKQLDSEGNTISKNLSEILDKLENQSYIYSQKKGRYKRYFINT